MTEKGQERYSCSLIRFEDGEESACLEHRTRIDWAEEIRQLLEIDYPHAQKIKLLCDNLNTHHIASLYEAFSAPEAHRLARRLELYFTPRNGSW